MPAWDSFLRVIFGFLLLAWVIAGGPSWAYVGILVIASGAWSYCPFFWKK